MKKKILAGMLTLLVLLGCITAGSAGSQSDPLISLSYLNGTYLTDLRTQVTQWVTENTRELAVGATQTADGWTVSNRFVPEEGEYGDTVTLATGSGLIWTDGSGAVSSGVLVDATAGAELGAGKALTAGHRYLAGADAVVAVSSQSARWMAEGKWRRGTGGTATVPLTFIDVPESQWYYDDVRFVVGNGLFAGVSDTQFKPELTMDRGMMVTVLHRLAKEPAVSYTPEFTDVSDGQWYTKGTIWCAQTGIVNGVGGGRFAPAQTVSRQEIAVMLYNYAVKTGHAAGERESLSAFSDAGAVASWAKDAVSWAVGAGILNGGNGKLLPADGAQRAQVAAMLHRFQNWLEAQEV